MGGSTRTNRDVRGSPVEIRESAENYLEAILVLSRKHERVRSIDLADHFGYSKPSISRAVSLLADGGYIDRAEDGTITLTASGTEVAESVYHRHETLTSWLVSIGVDPTTAADDACRIEHVISEETFERIHGQLGAE